MPDAFDGYAADYRELVEESVSFSGKKHDFFMRAKARVFEDHIRSEYGAGALGGQLKALDVGCGVGAMHPYVRSLFGHLAGVDVSGDSIARARASKAGADEYLKYDGERLPFAENAFDFTFCVCVLHHVPPANWQVFVREMTRVTRPGGTVAIVEHNPYNPLTRLAVARCPFDHDAVLLQRRRSRHLLRAAGIKRTRGRYFLFAPSEHALALSMERLLAGVPLGGQYVQFGMV